MKDIELSEHFKLSEFLVTDHKELEEENYNKALEIKDKLLKLAEFAESVRSVLGCPMVITSGFRCEKLNKAVGGSPTSVHQYGEAIDFIPMKMSAWEAFARIIISGISYQQCILEKRGNGYLIHISNNGYRRQKLYSPCAGKFESIL